MPGETFEPDQTPGYVEHVNDPTHPAGNEDLARDMANAEKPTRDRAASNRNIAEMLREGADISRNENNLSIAEQQEDNARNHEFDARRFDGAAEQTGEAARENYLASHPELTQRSEPAGGNSPSDDYVYKPAGDGNPQYLEKHPNAETDPSRAHDMANAGDDLRSIAVDDRHRAEEAAKREEEAEENLGEWGNKNAVLRSEYENQARSANFEKNQSISSAEMWDSTASAQEEWAGVLHDYPVSEKYQEDHPEARFTPEGLRMLEDHLLNLKFEAKRELSEEEVMGKFNDPNWGSKYLQYELGYGVEPEDDEENEEDHDIAESNPELAAILNNGTATMDDLKNYFRNKEQRYYEESRRKIMRLEKILEDVKSGKASDYTGEEESSENTGAAS
jgi:hypothetical protein